MWVNTSDEDKGGEKKGTRLVRYRDEKEDVQKNQETLEKARIKQNEKKKRNRQQK